jgi:hypothetical protein
MKKIILASNLLLAICLIFSSCKKDTTKTIEPDVNTTINYIKKTNGIDGYANYYYDTNNRLVKMENGPDDAMKMEYAYNSLGKISNLETTDSEGVTLTIFTYNAEGLLLGANTNNGLMEMTIEFENNKLVKAFAYGNIPNVGRTLMIRTEFDYTGENISEFREYSINIMTASLSLSEKVTFEHDNKKNPFYDLGIGNYIFNAGREQFASRNNCIKRTVVKSNYGDIIGSYEINFNYNSDGYPVSSSDGTEFTYYL